MSLGEMQSPDRTQAEQCASAALASAVPGSYLLGHLREAPARTEL